MNFTKETLIEQLNWRYATKKFDSNKKISPQDWEILEDTLRLAPSSYGLQPFQFIVVLNPEIRKKLTPASMGQAQIESCSHLVVVTHLKKVTEEYVRDFIERTAKTRSLPKDSLKDYENMMIGDLVKGPRSSIIPTWASRQAYISMGAMMTAAALLKIDVCPMEGFDPAQYEEILNLKNSAYTPVALLAAGYRAHDDSYQQARKVRFDKKDLIKVI